VLAPSGVHLWKALDDFVELVHDVQDTALVSLGGDALLLLLGEEFFLFFLCLCLSATTPLCMS